MSTETIAATLQACPFCGKDDIFLVSLGSHAFVECQGCGAKTGGYTSHRCSELAAEAWNTRAAKANAGVPMAAAKIPGPLGGEWGCND